MPEPESVPVPAGNAIRDEMAKATPGSPRSVELEAQLEATYRAALGTPLVAQPKPGAAPVAEPGQAPPDETVQRPGVFDDAHAIPQTAADLNTMAAPAFTLEAERAGWNWDPVKRQAVYATAEAEDLVSVVPEAQRLITRLAGSPLPDHEATDRQLSQLWSSGERDAKLDAADRFEARLRATHPAVLAKLERAGLTNHPQWLVLAAKAGERMVDPLTPGGWRRLKEKYTK